MVTMNNHSLRWATGDDLESILVLLEAYHQQENMKTHARNLLRGVLEDLFESPHRGKILIAEIDGEVVGYALLVRRFSFEWAAEVAILDEIFVKGRAREQGLGRRMINFCEDYAASEGLPAISLDVPMTNVSAREFYRSVGFSRIDREIYARPIDSTR
jgi:ribosomal protein S18 acetylase RimI-like enzyme